MTSMPTQPQATAISRFSSSSSSTFVPALMQNIHSASLLPSTCHNLSLLSIITQPVSKEMVTWIAQVFIASIDVDEGSISQSMLPTPPATPNKSIPMMNSPSVSAAVTASLPPLEEFIARLVQLSGAHVATLLSTLIYLERLCAVLFKQKGIPCSRHRVFLATLIVAAKYLNDCGPRNCNWTEYAQWFTNSEVNLMELQLLGLLNYHLRFTEEEACRHFAPFFFNSNSSIQYRIDRPIISSPIDSPVETVRELSMRSKLLTPSPSANGPLLSRSRTFSHAMCTPQKHISQKLRMPLLIAVKSNRSWTRCQKRNSTLSVSELLPPRIEMDKTSSSFLDLEMLNGMDLLSLSSPPSSSSQITSGPSQTTNMFKVPLTHKLSRVHDLNLPQQMSRRHPMIYPSDPLLLHSVKSDPNPLPLLSHSYPKVGGTSQSSPIRSQWDGFLRKIFGRHRDDAAYSTRPLGSQECEVFHEEKHHISVPLFKDILSVVPDQALESVVVC